MAPRITNNTGINQFTNVPTEMQTYIPAMYQNGADCYESKGKKTSRIIKSVTSIFNSVLLTAGLAIGGFFGFKWLKGSNLSFMSKPLQKYDFKDVANLKSEDIKGNIKQKEELKNVIDYCIKHKNKDGIPKGCGVLLQGPPRCGKTMSAKVFAKESGLTTFSCKSDDIISSVRGQTEKNVDKLFEQLRKRVKKDGKPVILIMDEIDSFLMKRDNATNEERAMVNAFLRNCDELEKQGIIILGSTNYSDKCDKAAVGSGRFNHTIQFDLPQKKDLEKMLRKGKKMLSSGEDDISKIASFMAEHHMNWADAQNVLNKYTIADGAINYKDAMLYLIEKCQGNSTVQISNLIQKDPPGTKTLDWKDIVGQSNVKKELENLAKNIKGKEELKSDQSGVTLYGPGGCGKTTLPYALGKKIGSSVYTLRIGENGVTVDNVKSVIEDIKLEGLKRKVNGEAPLILFIDEADAMFTNREGLDISHSVTNSLEKTTTMLNAIQNLQNSGVLCIAATNHLENIDGPIKERLKPLNVGYPNKEDVKEIIKRCVKDFDINGLDINKIASSFCDGETSKLSPRVIISVLQDELKKYQYTTLKKENKDEFYNSLEEIVKNKVEELNKNPLESSLTQISKSLDAIREEIGKISENKDEIKHGFEELEKHFKKLNGLDNLEDMKNALVSLRAAIGVPDKGKETYTLLNMIETLCAKLQGLENIKNIGKIDNAIQSINKLANSNNALAEKLVPVVDGLGVTMAHIDDIAEKDNSLKDDYKELAGSVATGMEEVKNALAANTGVIKGLNEQQGKLATAIGSLNKAQEELRTFLEKIKKEKVENKGKTKPTDLGDINNSIKSLVTNVNQHLQEMIGVLKIMTPIIDDKEKENFKENFTKKDNNEISLSNKLYCKKNKTLADTLLYDYKENSFNDHLSRNSSIISIITHKLITSRGQDSAYFHYYINQENMFDHKTNLRNMIAKSENLNSLFNKLEPANEILLILIKNFNWKKLYSEDNSIESCFIAQENINLYEHYHVNDDKYYSIKQSNSEQNGKFKIEKSPRDRDVFSWTNLFLSENDVILIKKAFNELLDLAYYAYKNDYVKNIAIPPIGLVDM